MSSTPPRCRWSAIRNFADQNCREKSPPACTDRPASSAVSPNRAGCAGWTLQSPPPPPSWLSGCLVVPSLSQCTAVPSLRHTTDKNLTAATSFPRPTLNLHTASRSGTQHTQHTRRVFMPPPPLSSVVPCRHKHTQTHTASQPHPDTHTHTHTHTHTDTDTAKHPHPDTLHRPDRARPDRAGPYPARPRQTAPEQTISPAVSADHRAP